MNRIYIFTCILFSIVAHCFAMDNDSPIESILQSIDQEIKRQYTLPFLVPIIGPSEENLIKVGQIISSQYPSIDDNDIDVLCKKNTYFAQMITIFFYRMINNLNSKMTIANIDEVYARKTEISGFDLVPPSIHTYCLNKVLQQIHVPIGIPLPLTSKPLNYHCRSDEKELCWFFVHTEDGKLSLWKQNELLWTLPEESPNKCFVKCSEDIKYLICGSISDNRINISIWDAQMRKKIYGITDGVPSNTRIADVDYLRKDDSNLHIVKIFTYAINPNRSCNNYCYPFVQVSQACPVQEVVYMGAHKTSSAKPFSYQVPFDLPSQCRKDIAFSRKDDLNLFLLNKAIDQTSKKITSEDLNQLSIYKSLFDYEKRFILEKVGQ